jgi:hypothetical protein
MLTMMSEGLSKISNHTFGSISSSTVDSFSTKENDNVIASDGWEPKDSSSLKIHLPPPQPATQPGHSASVAETQSFLNKLDGNPSASSNSHVTQESTAISFGGINTKHATSHASTSSITAALHPSGLPLHFNPPLTKSVMSQALLQSHSSDSRISYMSAASNTVPEFLYQLTKMLTDDNRDIIEWAKGKIDIGNKFSFAIYF